jgi:hypothetical protein
MAMFPDKPPLPARPGEKRDAADPAAAPSPARRMPLAGGMVFASVAELLLVVALAFSHGGHLGLVELAVLLLSVLFALGSCLLVGVSLQGRERGAWLLLGLACLVALIAQATRFGSLSSSAAPASYPSLASLALIFQSFGLFLAFLLFPPPASGNSLQARLGQFVDGALVVGAALVAVIYFVLVPFVQASHGRLSAAQVTSLAMCVGDLLLLGGMTFALRSMNLRHSPGAGGLSLLGLAALLLVGADFASMIQTPNHLAPLDTPLQAFWNAAYLGIGLGALLRLRGGGGKPASAEAEEAAPQEAGSSIWLILPFALTIVVAASIVVHAITRASTSTEMLVALICASLLVALIGARHLVGLVEARQMAEQRQSLEREAALAEERAEKLRSGQLAQTRARRENLDAALDALRRFGYGDYQARVDALDRELAPLAEQLNALLEGMERQLTDRDRGRETRLIRLLSDALGRLALGELYDLPELPTPGGSPLDGLLLSVVQVRNRLISLQGMIQQYERGHQEARQQVERTRQELEHEEREQRRAERALTQNLEEQLHSERQVAQATEEQWQRERERLRAQMQAAQTRVTELEMMLHVAEQRLVSERLKATGQGPEAQPGDAPRPEVAQLARVRERSAHLISLLTLQAERLHSAAATLQTAAGVAQRLAHAIHETAALPELQGANQPTLATTPQPTDASSGSQPMSALQMLERLAAGGAEAIPQSGSGPFVPPEGSGASGVRSASRPINEPTNARVAQRLLMAAGRADEIANGLLELAKQCIQAGDESARAAKEAGSLTAEAEPPKSPGLIRRPTLLPARTPKAGQ